MKKNEHSVIWHCYHTILAIELALVVVIEFIELMLLIQVGDLFAEIMLKSKCIEFDGYRCPNGYGQVRYKNKVHYTHRFVWEHTFGKIPKGLYVCHHCDNPPCINPDHLFLGTAFDNSKDKQLKEMAKSIPKLARFLGEII